MTIAGTLGVLKEKVARANADGRQVFIVTTPVSELIGAAWTTEHADVKGFAALLQLPLARRRRVEVARPRAARSCGRIATISSPAAARRRRRQDASRRVNIIGPTYGYFNSYSDLAEMKRLDRRDRRRDQPGLPVRSALATTRRASPTPKRRSSCIASSAFRSRARSDCRVSTRRSVWSRRRHSCAISARRSASRRGRGVHRAREEARRSPHGKTSGARRTATSSPTPRSRSSRRRRTKTASSTISATNSGLPIAYTAYRTGPESAPSEVVRDALATRARRRWSFSARSTSG